MNYLFTSESVSEGHPDKVSDQISDALLDEFLAYDPDSKVACETLVTTGQVLLAGEVKSKAYVDLAEVARRTIAHIGYTKSEYRFEANSCGVLSSIHEQSEDINRGVEKKTDPMDQGAGDQGMMFGYATNETDNYMPLPLDLSHALLRELANIRKEEPDLMPYLRPDAKSQVTIEYDQNNNIVRVDTVVVSTQHDPEVSQEQIRKDIIENLIMNVIPQKYIDEHTKIYVNPTGRFEIGGPHGDTGLTGRKIIVDTYGGRAPHGGGAFSGKDPTKVDRSAAYAARHLAKNVVAAGIARECTIQVSYAIGIAQPISINVNLHNSGNVPEYEIADFILKNVDLTPRGIIEKFNLRRPIYRQTAVYGHFGRDEFPWENLDLVDVLKKNFA